MRLQGAMIEACARQGYASTTVRELVTLAGVAPNTLYKHFESKEQCFLSTYDLIVREAVGRISAAYRGDAQGGERDWAAGLCRAFDAFAGELVERPAPSRLALVDVLAVGPPAVERIERAEQIFTWMIGRSLAQAPTQQTTIEPDLIRALIGGVWFVSRSRLVEGRPEVLASCGQELFEWILSYCSGGAASGAEPAPVPPRRGPVPRMSWEGGEHDERTGILIAAAGILSRSGYAGLSLGDIAQSAGVSSAAVEAYFDGVDDCFLATLELLSAAALARALRESEGAPTWAASIYRAVRALFCQLAEDRAFARAAFVDAFACGPASKERRLELMRSFADILARRAPAAYRPSALVAEAIIGSVWSLAHRQIAQDRAAELSNLSSRAAYLVLAPLIGADAASDTILAERDRERCARPRSGGDGSRSAAA